MINNNHAYTHVNFVIISYQCPGLIEQSFSCRVIVIARAIYQSVTITRPNRYLINLRVPKCVIMRERRRFLTLPVYGVIRLRMIYFVGIRLVHTFLGSAIRQKIADRVPLTSDRFASTFYTCVIYICPKLS